MNFRKLWYNKFFNRLRIQIRHLWFKLKHGDDYIGAMYAGLPILTSKIAPRDKVFMWNVDSENNVKIINVNDD